MLNGPTAFTIMFLVAAGMVGTSLGWITGTNLLDIAMVLGALFGSLMILKLPWDLYFEARHLQVEQEGSQKLEIDLDPDDVAFATKTSRRLLALCILSHLIAAGLAAGTSWLSGGKLGYYFSAFFLVSTTFRPLGSFYQHMMQRLRDLRRRTKYPREDVLELRARVQQLESAVQEMEQKRHLHETELRALKGRSDQGLEQLGASLRHQERQFTTKFEQVCHEFQRSIEKLTEDKELLEGVRAFVRMVKSA